MNIVKNSDITKRLYMVEIRGKTYGLIMECNSVSIFHLSASTYLYWFILCRTKIHSSLHWWFNPIFFCFQEPLYIARVIYDLLFFFIVIIIVLNLIFGVIIDTFADLRSEKQQKEEILKNTCFICGELFGTAFANTSRFSVFTHVYQQTHKRFSNLQQYPNL